MPTVCLSPHSSTPDFAPKSHSNLIWFLYSRTYSSVATAQQSSAILVRVPNVVGSVLPSNVRASAHNLHKHPSVTATASVQIPHSQYLGSFGLTPPSWIVQSFQFCKHLDVYSAIRYGPVTRSQLCGPCLKGRHGDFSLNKRGGGASLQYPRVLCERYSPTPFTKTILQETYYQHGFPILLRQFCPCG